MRSLSAVAWAGILLGLAAPELRAAPSCDGAPFFNVMRPRAIEESAGTTVGPQIFDVAPHPRGFVLMANNFGLLTYDGVGWRLMSLGGSGVALSVDVAPDGRIFAGGARTFGEVVEDPTGLLLYQPLENRLPPADRAFSDVWQTLVARDGTAYFRSRERLVRVRGGEAAAFSPSGFFSAAGLLGGVLYAQDTGAGLIAFAGAGPAPAPGGEIFRNLMVTALSEDRDGTLLVGTQTGGLFRFDVKAGRASPLTGSVPGLNAAEILSVRALGDGNIAVGTLRRGLFVLGPEGALRFTMDAESGLPNSAVLSLTAARGSLWAGTSGGAVQILLPNPVTNFSAREGLPGLVESVARHEDAIYAATSQGVFKMTCRGTPFEAVPAVRTQSFALLSAGALLAATADGVYQIDGAGARLVRPGRARGFAPSKEPDRIWVATQNGAAALRRVGGAWTADGTFKLPSGSAREGFAGAEATSVGEDADGRVWAALVTGQVISGTPFYSAAGPALTDLSVFGEREGLSGGFAEVMALSDGVRIGTSTAVLKPEGGRLVPDPVFTKSLGAGRGAFRIRETRDGGFWVASNKRPIRLTRAADGGLEVRSSSLLRTPAGSRILDFLEVSEREMWIGTDDGAFRYDPALEPADRTPGARIRRVESGPVELFAGGATDVLEAPLPYLASLRFEVASSSLDDPSRNRFRFRLDGQDDAWSPWTADTRKDYTNLGPGTHRFRVETVDVYGNLGREAAFSFTVLAPWYLKPWAMVLGLLALVGLIAGTVSLRTRALRRRQRELEIIVDQKTTELREASFTDPLTGLRNRRYFAEVIEGEASLATRPDSPALHMFLVDLDHFKLVNDTHGHAAGDAVLRQTSARLKVAMRTSDLIFRWGGEEFLVVARGAPDLPRNEIANRIVRMMGTQPFDIGDGTLLSKTCSVGFASYPFYVENPTTVPLDAVIELADLALYRAKQTGRNRAVGVSPQAGVPVPGEVWKDKVLENLEKEAVSVEVVEGPRMNGVSGAPRNPEAGEREGSGG